MLSALTCWKLQASVDGHSRPLVPCHVHCELQVARVGVDTVGEGEGHLIRSPADSFRCVHQEPIQDILVGEGGALREDAAILQRLGVELPPAELP